MRFQRQSTRLYSEIVNGIRCVSSSCSGLLNDLTPCSKAAIEVLVDLDNDTARSSDACRNSREAQ